MRPWFLGGRIVALRKEGDDADADASRRKLRPIAIGSVFCRVVSMVAALTFRGRFAAYLLPLDALSPSGAEAAYVERCDDQPAPDPACCFDCPVDPAPAEQ